MQFQLAAMILGAIVLILLSVQNTNLIKLQFLGSQIRPMPQSVIILLAVLIGIIISATMGLIQQLKLKAKINKLKKEIDEIKKS